MAKKELNLLQLASGGTAEADGTSAEVVRCEFADADIGSKHRHAMPDELFCHAWSEWRLGEWLNVAWQCGYQ